MSRLVPLALLSLLSGSCMAASVAAAAPGGPIGTLPHGDYICELPGDALGQAGIHQADFDFTVTNASSYRTAKGTGIYLMTGDRVTFTSGPFYGVRYHRISGGFLRRTEADGKDGDLRCVRRGGSDNGSR